MTETASEIPKPPVKRALFNKPAWSRPQNLASPVDFFHRANSASLDPVVEAERKRKARAVKKEAEKARQKEEKPAEKRRRLSGDDNDDLYGVSDQEVKPGFPSCKANGPLERTVTDEGSCTARKSSLKREPSPKSLSKRFEDETVVKEIEKKFVPQSSNIIDLEESDDEDLEMTQVKKPPPPPPEEEDFPASDEEYAELARKAREKARTKRLQDDILAETQKQSISSERDRLSQQPFSTYASTPPPPPPPPLDPQVSILVTSRLENAVPLIVKRRLSQRLKDVRLAWCFHNHFTEDNMLDSIFLTWRGKRLFDVTSCKSLGIAVDYEGRVMAKDQEDILADEERKIHMEAMTEDIYEEYQKAKRRATEQQDEDKEEEQAAPQQRPPKVQLRLILKAKGCAEFKLMVKPVSRDRKCMLEGSFF